MFAVLGDIEFDLITYFNGFSEENSYSWAEHARIGQKPITQFLGENLCEQSIKLNFHSAYCTPEEEIDKLKFYASQGEPLKFIKGNGDYVGVFTITSINAVTEHSDNYGNLISTQVDVKLKEYTGPIQENDEFEGGFTER